MKKLILLFSLVLFSFSFIACSSDFNKESTVVIEKCEDLDFMNARQVANFILKQMQDVNGKNMMCLLNSNNNGASVDYIEEFLLENKEGLMKYMDGVKFDELVDLGSAKFDSDFIYFEMGRSAEYGEVYTIALTKENGQYLFEDMQSPDIESFDLMADFLE